MEVQVNHDTLPRPQLPLDILVPQSRDDGYMSEEQLNHRLQDTNPVIQSASTDPKNPGPVLEITSTEPASTYARTESTVTMNNHQALTSNHESSIKSQPSNELATSVEDTVNGSDSQYQAKETDRSIPDDCDRSTSETVSPQMAVLPNVKADTIHETQSTEVAQPSVGLTVEAAEDPLYPADDGLREGVTDRLCAVGEHNYSSGASLDRPESTNDGVITDVTEQENNKPDEAVFQGQNIDPGVYPVVGSDYNIENGSMMETDCVVPSALESVNNSNDKTDQSNVVDNVVAFKMTENINSEHSSKDLVEPAKPNSTGVSDLASTSIAEVTDSVSKVVIADPSLSSSGHGPTFETKEDERRTGTPNSETDVHVAKKKPKKLESILSNLKSKSLLPPVIPEVEFIPVEEEPIPELPPGTVVVKPMDADTKTVRRKKHRKIKKHDRPLNKEKLKGMINAATDIKDLCGVTDGIIDLTAVEGLDTETFPPQGVLPEMTGNDAGMAPMLEAPNLIHQQDLPPGVMPQQSAQQPVMVTVPQNGSSIANTAGNVTFLNSASSQLQFLQRQQQTVVGDQSTPPFQQPIQMIKSGQNLIIQQGKPIPGPQIVVQGQAQPMIINQASMGGQAMPSGQVNSPLLTAHLQQPRLMAPQGPQMVIQPGVIPQPQVITQQPMIAQQPMVAQQPVVAQQPIILSQQGQLALQQHQQQQGPGGKSQPIFVLQRGDTLKLDASGNLVVVAKDDGKTNPPVAQPTSSVQPTGVPVGNLPLPPLQQMRFQTQATPAEVRSPMPSQLPYGMKPVTTVGATNMGPPLPPLKIISQPTRPISTVIPSSSVSSVANAINGGRKSATPPSSVVYIPNTRAMSTSTFVVKPAPVVQTTSIVTPQKLSTTPTYAVNLQSGNITPAATSVATPQNVNSAPPLPTDVKQPQGILAEALNAPKSAYVDSASGLHLAASGLVQQKNLPNSHGQALLAKLAQPQVMQAITNAANSMKNSAQQSGSSGQQAPKQIRIVYRSSASGEPKTGGATEPKKVTLFSCSVCTKIFLRKDSYQQHLLSHYSAHSCPNCPRKFINALQLSEHGKSCPKRPKSDAGFSFSCGHCAEKFKLSRDLTPHTHIAHRGLPVKAIYHSLITTKEGQQMSSTPISIHSVNAPATAKTNILNNKTVVITPVAKASVAEKPQPPPTAVAAVKPVSVSPASGTIQISTVIKREKEVNSFMANPTTYPEKPKSPRKVAEKDDDWVPPAKSYRKSKKFKLHKGKKKNKQKQAVGGKVWPKYLMSTGTEPGYPKTEKVHSGDDFYGGILIQKDPECTSSILLRKFGGSKKSGKRPFTCKLCPKDFFSEHCLFEHIKIHVKPFTCGECGLKNARKDNIMKHIQLVHQGPKYRTRDQRPNKRRKGVDDDGNGKKKAKLGDSSSGSPGGEVEVDSDSELPTMVKKPTRQERMERRYSNRSSSLEGSEDVIDQLTCVTPEGVTGGKVTNDGSNLNVSEGVNDDKIGDVSTGKDLAESSEHAMSSHDSDHQYAAKEVSADEQEEDENKIVNVVGETNDNETGGEEDGPAKIEPISRVNDVEMGDESSKTADDSSKMVDDSAEKSETITGVPESNEAQLESSPPAPENEAPESLSNNNDDKSIPSTVEGAAPDMDADDAIEAIDDSVLEAKKDQVPEGIDDSGKLPDSGVAGEEVKSDDGPVKGSEESLGPSTVMT